MKESNKKIQSGEVALRIVINQALFVGANKSSEVFAGKSRERAESVSLINFMCETFFPTEFPAAGIPP